MSVTVDQFIKAEKLIPELSVDDVSVAILATKIEISDEWRLALPERINSSFRNYILDRLMEHGARAASPRLREKRLREIISLAQKLENMIIDDNDPVSGSTALELRRAAHKIVSSESKAKDQSFENDSTLDGILGAIALLVRVACWRRLNFDHLCRLNFDQGLLLT